MRFNSEDIGASVAKWFKRQRVANEIFMGRVDIVVRGRVKRMQGIGYRY